MGIQTGLHPSADITQPSRDGNKKVERWLAAMDTLESAKRGLSRAETELRNAEQDLGAWLWPKNAKSDEKIAVCYGNGLIQVSKPPVKTYPCGGGEPIERRDDFKVEVRKRWD